MNATASFTAQDRHRRVRQVLRDFNVRLHVEATSQAASAPREHRLRPMALPVLLHPGSGGSRGSTPTGAWSAIGPPTE